MTKDIEDENHLVTECIERVAEAIHNTAERRRHFPESWGEQSEEYREAMRSYAKAAIEAMQQEPDENGLLPCPFCLGESETVSPKNVSCEEASNINDSCREAFEEYADACEYMIDRVGDGYEEQNCQWAWEAWQAAYNLPTDEVAFLNGYIKHLQEENERLREALENITKLEGANFNSDEMYIIAKQALEATSVEKLDEASLTNKEVE